MGMFALGSGARVKELHYNDYAVLVNCCLRSIMNRVFRWDIISSHDSPMWFLHVLSIFGLPGIVDKQLSDNILSYVKCLIHGAYSPL